MCNFREKKIDLEEDHSKEVSVAQSQDCVLGCILWGLACTMSCLIVLIYFSQGAAFAVSKLVKVFATIVILPKIF